MRTRLIFLLLWLPVIVGAQVPQGTTMRSTNGYGIHTTLYNSTSNHYFTNSLGSAGGFAIDTTPKVDFGFSVDGGIYVEPNAFGASIDAQGGGIFGGSLAIDSGGQFQIVDHWRMGSESSSGPSVVFTTSNNQPITNIASGFLHQTNVDIRFTPGYPPTVSFLNRTGGPVNLSFSGTISGYGVSNSYVIDVTASPFNARGDLVVSTGSISSNSSRFTNSTALSAADVGKYIGIFGAGLTNSDFLGTILSVENGNEALLSSVVQGSATNARSKIFTDNRAAFQDAINYAGSLDGAEVFVPTGRYGMFASNYLATTTSGGGFLVMPTLFFGSNNVSMKGLGESWLDFIGVFRRPDADAPVRSAGIRLVGSITNISFTGITFDGGVAVGYQTYGGFPASMTNGSGWDISHKGIIFDAAVTADQVFFSKCEFKFWQGEIIFSGSEDGAKLAFDDCLFHDYNASGINPNNQLFVNRTDFRNGRLVTEFGKFQSHPGSFWTECTFSNMYGFAVVGQNTNRHSPITIKDCRFMYMTNNALTSGNGTQISVHNSRFEHCASAFSVSSAGIQGTSQGVDVNFKDNIVSDGTYGIIAGGAVASFLIDGNVFTNTQFPVEYYGAVTNMIVSRNFFSAGTGPTVAGAIDGTLPLFVDNHYERLDTVPALTFVMSGNGAPFSRGYIAEKIVLNSGGFNGAHEISLLTNQVPPHAVVEFSVPASDDSVFTFSNLSNSIVVPQPRYLHGVGDSLVVAFVPNDGRWHEVSYTPGSWKSAAAPPSGGTWFPWETINSTTVTNQQFVYTGSAWITNVISTTNVIISTARTTIQNGSANTVVVTSGNLGVGMTPSIKVSVAGPLWSNEGTTDTPYAAGATGANFIGTGGSWGLRTSTDGGLRVDVGNTNRIAISPAGLITMTGDTFVPSIFLTNGVIWQGGAQLTNIYTATATLDFGNAATIGCSDLTITVTGAALGDVVDLGVPNASVVANSSYSAWVSAADTVTVRFCALISGDPASGVFRAEVHKWK